MVYIGAKNVLQHTHTLNVKDTSGKWSTPDPAPFFQVTRN